MWKKIKYCQSEINQLSGKIFIPLRPAPKEWGIYQYTPVCLSVIPLQINFLSQNSQPTVSSSHYIYYMKPDHDELLCGIEFCTCPTSTSCLTIPRYVFPMEIFRRKFLSNCKQQPLHILCEASPWWVEMWDWVLYLSHTYFLLNNSALRFPLHVLWKF